jgi:hypothetical protein
MHDMSASVQGIVCRSSLCFVLDFLIYGANSPFAIGQAASDEIKSFYDDALKITYFHLADFVPTQSRASGDGSRCIKPALFANSDTAVDSSSFTPSTEDLCTQSKASCKTASVFDNCAHMKFWRGTTISFEILTASSSDEFAALSQREIAVEGGPVI